MFRSMAYLCTKPLFLLAIGLILILVVGACGSVDQETGQSTSDTGLFSYTVPSPSSNIESSVTNPPIPMPTIIPDFISILLPTPLAEKPLLKSNNSLLEYEIAVAEIYENIPKYSRSEWNHWFDTDNDCQNARHEVLIEESLEPVEFKTDKKCQVKSGKWFAVYSGQEVTDATKLDIDHMVPLKNAHDSGGWSWDKDRKKAFANDMEYQDHLIAVTASANRKKGAKGPEGWKPSDQDYWCEYAIDWIQIKMEWDLTATQVEWEALQGMLKTCENPPLVTVVPSKIKPPVVLKTAVPRITTSSEARTVEITSIDCKGKPEKLVITNSDKSIANLTGWKIEDEGPKHKFEFPKDFLLEAGGSTEIISGTTGENTATQFYWKKSTVWNNDGDTAHLFNSAGELVAKMECP